MKHRYFRVCTVLLALLLLSAGLLACADTNTPQPTATPTDAPQGTPTVPVNPSDTPRLTPDIPETYDFNGESVNFLYWYLPGWEDTVRYCRDITCEDYSGDRVSAAVYDRNATVEEHYKVKITVDIQSYEKLRILIGNDISTGDQCYQAAVPVALDAGSMVSMGYFLNFGTIPHVDLDQPWWDQDCIEQLQSNERIYLITSSLLVNDKDATSALVFSKKAATDLQLDSFYAMVSAGDWTYETVADYSSRYSSDTNGDQVMGEEDFWGFLGQNDVMLSFYHGSGSRLAEKDGDDAFAFAFAQTEDSVNAAQAVLDFMRDDDCFYNAHVRGTDDVITQQLFTSGQGLFYWVRLDKITNMRDSELEFGILPTPKYTAAQTDYYSTVSPHTGGMLAIPASNSGAKLEMTGMILEALSAESHYTLQPAYIEDSLKTRYSRDGESKDMLDIILNSRVFDPACIYDFGSFTNKVLTIAQNGNAEIVSFTETNAEAVCNAIETFNEYLEELSLLQ